MKVKTNTIYFILCLMLGTLLGYSINQITYQETLINVMIIFIITMIIGFPLATIIHESGHLIMGLITNYHFVSFQIGKVMIIKQNQHLKMKKCLHKYHAGQCLLAPPEYSAKFPYFLYIAGGGFFNLIITILMILLFLVSSNHLLKIVLLTFGFINGYLCLINLIPIKALVNDGYHLYLMNRDQDSRYSFYKQLKIGALQANGMLLQDMEIQLFKLSQTANLNNPLHQRILIARINLFHEQLKFKEAKALIDYISQRYQLSKSYQQALQYEYLFYLIMDAKPKTQIKQYYQEISKDLVKGAKNNLNCQRIMYAYKLLIENDVEQAQKYLECFNHHAKTYPYISLLETEKKIILLIKQLKASKS